MLSVFVRQTLVQLVTPDRHARARGGGLDACSSRASNELGEFESGLAARFLGAGRRGGVRRRRRRWPSRGVWAFLFPALRRADRLE